jgi:hypothetical protein
MNKLIPFSLSHFLYYCSVGAIVRGPDMLMTVKDTSYWMDHAGNPAGRLLLYVERVRVGLKIDQKQGLREPPIAKLGVHRKVEGTCVPAIKFPAWDVCPACGLLHYLPAMKNKDTAPRCQGSNSEKCPSRPRLKQVSDVLVHEEGYMDDIPWHYLAHLESKSPSQFQCRKDNQIPYLYLNKTTDRSQTSLSCSRCGAERKFNSSLGNRINRMDRRQPWLRESVPLKTGPQIMRVNDIRIHIPINKSALVIPPESRIKKGTVVDRLYNSSAKRRRMESCKPYSLAWRSTIRGMAGEFRCPVEDVEAAWKQIENGYPLYGQQFNITEEQLFEDEYSALIEDIPDVSEDEDFVTRHYTAGWKQLAASFNPEKIESKLVHAIDRVIAATRLKEIMVFKGFKRVDFGEKRPIPPDITGESGWLPAVELFGEGIFITLDPAMLEAWENLPDIAERALEVQKRYQAVPVRFDVEITKVSPRFLLLHTLSHLLIRQLECDCGYPAASLKERIYWKESDPFMAGILIYVAVPDVAGSLGGIAEIAEPMRFLRLASAAVARAQWCSLDPVCSEHEGQGLHLLNRAACHACALVPEPSCNYQNMLLDRVFIKGDPASGMPSFLDYAYKVERQAHGQTEI